VNRYTPGIEKTFFNGNASLEFRLPFASTVSPDITTGAATGMQTLLGDLVLTGKVLLYNDHTVALSSGVAVTLPTAEDVRVSLPNGQTMVRIRNESVVLTPYLAMLLLPSDEMFIQTWVEFAFDTTGSPVALNPNMTGLQTLGRTHDQVVAQVDTQMGYWLYQAADHSCLLRGLAPFIELHYNSQITNADVINNGGFTVGTNTHLNELNLAAGLVTRFGDNFTLLVGAVVPLKSAPDRSFDYQIGIRGNLLFGPTARQRGAAAQAPSSF
jgi:hypothetical protein